MSDLAHPGRTLLAQQLGEQAEACRLLGSPMYARILDEATADALAGGPVWSALGDLVDEGSGPRGSALPLRFMAAVHRLVLEGRAPDLATVYPSAGGSGSLDPAWPAFRALVEDQGPVVARLAARRCQTNEVGRTAALLGGFLLVAERFGLPLRLLELGASAGLGLRWDRYRFESDAASWGDQASPVLISGVFRNAPPALAAPVSVEERRGCDPAPVDPLSPDGRLALTSAVWADQHDRLARLRGALDVAAEVPATVDRGPAREWVPARLAALAPGVATVVYHTVVWQYLAPAEQTDVRDAIRRAGSGATVDAPLAWLRMEPAPSWREGFAVDLTTWPGGQERRLAEAHPHGSWVKWLV